MSVQVFGPQGHWVADVGDGPELVGYARNDQGSELARWFREGVPGRRGRLDGPLAIDEPTTIPPSDRLFGLAVLEALEERGYQARPADAADLSLASFAAPEGDSSFQGAVLLGWVREPSRGKLPRWRNTETGEFRYQMTPPGGRSPAAAPGAGPPTQAPRPAEATDRPRGLAPAATSPTRGPSRSAPSPTAEGHVRAALADPSHPINRLRGQVRAVSIQGQTIPTVVPTPQRPLSAEDHQRMGEYHARLGGLLRQQGRQELADANLAAARYHHDQAAAAPPGPAAPGQAPAPLQAPASGAGKAPSGVASPTGPAKAPTFRPALRPEHAAALREVGQRLGQALAKAQLPPHQQEAYRQSANRALARLSETALRRLHKNLGEAQFHASVPDVARAFAQAAGRPVEEYASRKIGGFYDPNTGALNLDGGLEHLNPDMDRDGIYAHEIAHAVDGRNMVLSRSAAWQEAYRAEIDRPDNPLSQYARTSPQEGFAEFGRLLWSDRQEEAQRLFPRCYAFWKKGGLV